MAFVIGVGGVVLLERDCMGLGTTCLPHVAINQSTIPSSHVNFEEAKTL